MSFQRTAALAAVLVAVSACAPTNTALRSDSSAAPAASPAASTAPATPGTPGLDPATYDDVDGLKAIIDGEEIALTQVSKASNANGIALNATGPRNNVILTFADKNRQAITASTPPADVTMTSGLMTVNDRRLLYDATVTPTQELIINDQGIKGFFAFGLTEFPKPGETAVKHTARLEFNLAWSEL